MYEAPTGGSIDVITRKLLRTRIEYTEIVRHTANRRLSCVSRNPKDRTGIRFEPAVMHTHTHTNIYIYIRIKSRKYVCGYGCLSAHLYESYVKLAV